MISIENINNPDYHKSSYLYNLTRFVFWPQNAFNFSVSPFLIGIVGEPAFTNTLISTLRDKKILNREWKVECFKSVESINYCHLLFATGVDLNHVKSIIRNLSDREILFIGDNISGFCQAGGMINLVGTSPNFGYEINMKAMNNARLSVVPDFLELATLIE